MAKKELMCPYSESKGVKAKDTFDVSFRGKDPRSFYTENEVRSTRVKCPVCGRKLMSDAKTCDDGCCVYHNIPSHKKKEWWKKKKIIVRNKNSHRRRRG